MRLLFRFYLERVGNEVVERKDADKTDNARNQAKLSIGAGVEKPDQYQHHYELQEISKEIEASVPDDGRLGNRTQVCSTQPRRIALDLRTVDPFDTIAGEDTGFTRVVRVAHCTGVSRRRPARAGPLR